MSANAGHRIAVVGGGHAAAAFVAQLRSAGHTGPVTLLTDEPVPPYQRPPLSKRYLAGAMTAAQLLLRPPDWYAQQGVQVRTDCRVEGIDRAAGTLHLPRGERLAWDGLALLTGARPRRLPAALGGDLCGVHSMRSVADADALAPALSAGRRLLVLGGGYIGLEAAAAARSRGLQVAVIEAAPRILQRVAAPATADAFRALHAGHGVEILEATALARLVGEGGRLVAAELSDGRHLPVDLAVIGIGVEPNVELASEAGLDVNNGIVVDASARSSDARIVAAGDCACFEFRGQRIRLESVQNANDQAAVAARALLGLDARYEPLPWFWSDQYDCKLQIAGLNLGHDRAVVRPGSTERGQSVWYFKSEQLLAVDAINEPLAFVTARKWLAAQLSPSPDRIGDRAWPLSL